MAEARREPGRLPAIILAVLVHLAFIALLVFGVDWQTREPAPVIAELWNSLPGAAPSPPPPRPEPKPEPPKPAPPKPEPRPEPKPEPKPAQADIALKAEKLKEEKRKLEEETRKKEVEKKKKQQEEEEKRRVLEEFNKDQKTLQEQRDAQVKADAAAKAVTQQAAAARGREVEGFKAKIIAKIKPLVNNQPCQALNNPEAEFEVRLMPTGMLLADPRLKKSSGSAQCDQAIERAILRAQPLPLPPNPALFDDFREINLKFRPNE